LKQVQSHLELPGKSVMLFPMASFDQDTLKQKIARLAASGIFIGTSSWKYSGWRGMLNDDTPCERWRQGVRVKVGPYIL
jgi:hypothetical protein